MRLPLRHLLPLAVSAALIALLLAPPGPAQAQRNIQLGLFDDLYVSPQNWKWLGLTADAGAQTVRIPVRWKYLAPRPPSTPRQPDDPAYGFSGVDRAVRAAQHYGLEPVLTITTAPAWAERGKRPAGIKQEGAWNPKPAAFGSFARAVAARYSGGFHGLPRVRFYEAFNEPNYGLTHLAPQWRRGKPYGVKLYRQLLNSLYAGVKGVHRTNRVVAPSLGPQGRTPNRRGTGNALSATRPLFFLRELFCLRHNAKMTPKRCPKNRRPRFDVLSHHPINPGGSPRAKAAHPDSVIGGDLGKLRRVLRRAEKAGNTIPRKARRPMWVTEFWWETNPPDRRHGIKPVRQAHNIQEALYVFWRAKVQRAFGFRIRDAGRTSTGGVGHGNAAGLYTVSERPKPSLRAFRFPFVGDRRGKRKVLAWGRAPVGGQVRIERKTSGRWRVLARTRARAGKVFVQHLRLKGKARLRASIPAAGERSLAWRVPKR